MDFFDWDTQMYFSPEPFTYANNEFVVTQTSDTSLIGTYNIGVWVYFAAYPNGGFAESAQSFKLTIE